MKEAWEIDPDLLTVGELVAGWPSAAPLLASLQIDFCFRTERTVARACADAGIDVEELLGAMQDELTRVRS